MPTLMLAQYNGGAGDGHIVAVAEVLTLSNPDFAMQVSNITVAPNPTINIVNVTLDTNDNLEINARLYDIRGRIIKDEWFDNNNFEIDLSSQGTGVYILHILSEGKLIGTRKLMKL
ncbi:MAG: T9SS type A sorting domain-containing protein [Flavobacteriaceae bacterium]|nr:T9SS type A sorting domain-containing protein [Flavobacteriaceae bacterium]